MRIAWIALGGVVLLGCVKQTPEPAPPPRTLERPTPIPPFAGLDDLLGMPAVFEARELGTIADLLLDLRKGSVTHAVVASSDPLPRRWAVPWGQIEWRTAGGRRAVVRGTEPPVELETLYRPAVAGSGAAAEDYRALFAERPLETLEGEITAFETRAESTDVVLRLVTDNNLHHRVLLGPPGVLGDEPPLLGEAVVIQAVQTRDERGMLWVCRSVERDGPRVAVRDAAGVGVWEADIGAATARADETSLLAVAELVAATVFARGSAHGPVRALLVSTGPDGEGFVTVGSFAVDHARDPALVPLAALTRRDGGFEVPVEPSRLHFAPALSSEAGDGLTDPEFRAEVYRNFALDDR